MAQGGFWEHLSSQFDLKNFPDIFTPIWIAALIGLIVTVILYNVRTRQLHRHEPLRNLQEWLLWTGLAMFGLVLVGTLFKFYFLFIVLFIVIGIAVLVWIRFFRFPPYIEAYNEQLRRARFYTQARFKQAESTVRSRRSRQTQRRRRR